MGHELSVRSSLREDVPQSYPNALGGQGSVARGRLNAGRDLSAYPAEAGGTGVFHLESALLRPDGACQLWIRRTIECD